MIADRKKWSVVCMVFFLFFLSIHALIVFYIDPYFHYHEPNPNIYYALDDHYYISIGVLRNFNYDSAIVGSSMSDCFKTSEWDELMGTKSVKTPIPGATYHEIMQYESAALESGNNIKTIIRPLDYMRLMGEVQNEDKENTAKYLWDSNPFDDVLYIWNMDVVPILVKDILHTMNGKRGVQSFDTYENWSDTAQYGEDAIIDYIISTDDQAREYAKQWYTNKNFTADDRNRVVEQFTSNVTSNPSEYSKTQFYYFFPPYSIYFWRELDDYNQIDRWIDAETIAIETMLQYDNIHLFSFNTEFKTITDLDNYKDKLHYGGWINSYILKCMYDGKNQITKENYKEYLDKERVFYTSYNYSGLRTTK